MFQSRQGHENITVQFSKQGENNRETCALDARRSLDVPQHFGSSNRSPC